MSAPAAVARHSTLSDLIQLTKPRISLTVTFTTLVGYAMGTSSSLLEPRLAATLIGTALVASGASTLNMLMEQDIDALMERTRGRPLPAGRLQSGDALRLGTVLTALGIAVLAFWSQPAAAGVAILTWATYLFIYTPLKPRTSLSTLVGAFPGALPPVIGWAAADQLRRARSVRALRDSVSVANPPLPGDRLAVPRRLREGRTAHASRHRPHRRTTGRQAVANCIALLLVSLAPAAAGMAGRLYLTGAVVLGVGFTAVAVKAAVKRDLAAARQLFLSSMLYIVCLFSLLLLDRT